MATEQCVSAYATAKICGFNGSYSDFKNCTTNTVMKLSKHCLMKNHN